MDHLVEEQAPRNLQVLDWGNAIGAARGDLHGLHAADPSGRDVRLHGGVVTVEAAVETDHDAPGAIGQRIEHGLHLAERRRQRLLAIDRLAGLGRRQQQCAMGVGGRSDDDGIDIARSHDGFGGDDAGAVSVGDDPRAVHQRIGDRDDAGMRIAQ